MHHTFVVLICCTLIATCALSAGAQRVAVSETEAAAWIRYTVPLPKKLQIPAKVVFVKGDVVIEPPSVSGPSIDEACKELRDVTGQSQHREGAAAPFKITMQIGGSEADALKSLRNSSQAYSIAPEAGDKGLRLVSLTADGMFYAAKTLQQLIKAHLTDTSVEIPLLTVTDWPDMQDRGLWGGETFGALKWLAERKMNYLEQTSARSVSPDGRGHGGINRGWQHIIDEGPPLAMSSVPIVSHLEQSGGTGIFDVYPNLKAKGPNAGGICYSQPGIVEVLTDWIADLASVPGVSGVDVWMTENLAGKTGCQCDECKKTDRNVLEVRTILAAWRKAEERVGRKIQLYVLSSEETFPSNRLVLKELPSEVRFWFYYWLTYNTGRSPMIPRPISDAAAEGKWVGVVPSLDSMTSFLEPFTGADFIHYRMNEFVDKKLNGLLGFATPRVIYNDFNVEAAAEWSWNAKGRTPQEFILSHAIRQGIKNPEKWAEWAGLVGPVEWNIYGSDWTTGAQRGTPDQVAQMLIEGRLPKLGTILWDAFRIPFGDIKTVEQLDGDVAAAAKALAMAKEMGIPEYWYESVVADGYIKSLKALWELRGLVKNGKVAPEDRDSAGRYFAMYLDGLKQASDAMPKWEEIKDIIHENRHYTDIPIKTNDRLRKEMADVAAKLGIEAKL